MRRQLKGLSRAAAGGDVADGIYLVKVQRAHYRWHKYKPFYELSFYILEPAPLRGGAITAHLYCSPKTLWKFAWFLREFRYNQELLERDEIDVKALIGLEGIVQVVNEVVRGRSETNLKAFGPAVDWEHLRCSPPSHPEVA